MAQDKTQEINPVMNTGTPWNTLGPINDVNILNTGMELLGVLAQAHAAGEGVGLKGDTLYLSADGHLHVSGSPGGRPQTDIFAAGVLLLRRMLQGDVPSELAPHRLIPYVNALVPPVPPAVPYLLEELLTPDVQQRPLDALRPYRDWAAAAAWEDVRFHANSRYKGQWSVAAETHIGWAKMLSRQTNQDAIWHGQNEYGAMMVVADGISEGQVGTGDMASRVAVDVVRAAWNEGHPNVGSSGGQEFLVELMRKANDEICKRALALAGGPLNGRIPMGTTAVVALCRTDTVEIAALGDSRAYLIGPCGAGILTADQNGRLQALRNRVTVDERVGDALTGYLGHLDPNGASSLLPVWYRRFRILPGETLLLCSDGVTDFAAKNHLSFVRDLYERVPKMAPAQIARDLVGRANEGGGGDNVSVIVARME